MARKTKVLDQWNTREIRRAWARSRNAAMSDAEFEAHWARMEATILHPMSDEEVEHAVRASRGWNPPRVSWSGESAQLVDVLDLPRATEIDIARLATKGVVSSWRPLYDVSIPRNAYSWAVTAMACLLGVLLVVAGLIMLAG